jgi:ribosomal protein S27E
VLGAASLPVAGSSEDFSMKINCIACGHNFDVDEAYDDYEGPVRCWVCGTLLDIKTEEGHIRRLRMAGSPPQETTKEPVEGTEGKRPPGRAGRPAAKRGSPATTASEG